MGMISIVGIGPGGREHLTDRAARILREADTVIGYKTYIDLVTPFFDIRDARPSGMRREVERCREALALAREGKHVAIVSSGDPGIYGMAGPMLEVMREAGSDLPVEVVPGVTAASAAAAVLGAPLMHDFAVISLSDLLTPIEVIRRRVTAAAQADFVICLYNPRSASRIEPLREATALLLEHRNGATPVGVVRDALRQGEESFVTDLDHLLAAPLDMASVVIVGNAATFVAGGRMITPRGYVL